MTSTLTTTTRTVAPDTRVPIWISKPLGKPDLRNYTVPPGLYCWDKRGGECMVDLCGNWQPKIHDVTLRAAAPRTNDRGFYIRNTPGCVAHGPQFKNVHVEGTANAIDTAFDFDASDGNADHSLFEGCGAWNCFRGWSLTGYDSYDHQLYGCSAFECRYGISADNISGSFRATGFKAGAVSVVAHILNPTRPCELSGEAEHSDMIFDVARGGPFKFNCHDFSMNAPTRKWDKDPSKFLIARWGCEAGLRIENLHCTHPSVIEVFVPQGKTLEDVVREINPQHCDAEFVRGQW